MTQPRAKEEGDVDRRTMLRALVVGAGTAAFSGSLWSSAFAAPAQPAPASPYGPLGGPDGNGIQLPAGFTCMVVARSGQVVGGSGYLWHDAPDGGACFGSATDWVYVSNSEIGNGGGGASAITFNASGIVSAYRILAGTNRNCAGGATPWNTWLSCEEVSRGLVYETHPLNRTVQPTSRPAMGRFTHEAAAVDATRGRIYLTEDETDGCFYRFTPATWPDLRSGTLEVLVASGDPTPTSGPIPCSWKPVTDPAATKKQTRSQVRGAKRFNGGEGCYYANDICYFTTKGDNRVWAYNAAHATLDLAYDDSLATSGTAPLVGVDNITGNAAWGDLYIAEDGGNMEINMIWVKDVNGEPTGPYVTPFLRILGQSSSEICGPAFSPDGTRLYFSSQRGATGLNSGGVTYQVQGPFRR